MVKKTLTEFDTLSGLRKKNKPGANFSPFVLQLHSSYL